MGSSETAGNKAALENANAAYSQYNKDYGNWQNQYNQYRSQADQYRQQADQYRNNFANQQNQLTNEANKSWGQDFGKNAQDFTNKANQSGIQAANQQLDQQARGAVNQAQLAGRAAGLSKGQAAMNAANIAGQTYQSGYGNAVQQGIQNYGQAVGMNQQNSQNKQANLLNRNAALQDSVQNQQTNTIQGQGMTLQGQGMTSQGMQGMIGAQAGVGANQKSQFDKNMGILGLGAGIASGLASAVLPSDRESKQKVEPSWESEFMERLMALSDERIKEPTQEKDLLAEVAESINNYTYHYKPGVGENPSVEYSGPMAQELLQVDGYRSCVFEDENGLLKVDTARLALVNAGMIADLSKRLLMLEEFIKSAMAGLAQGAAMPDVE